MAEVLQQALEIYGKVGLRINLGPGKTYLILPKSYVRSSFPYPLDDPGVAAPRVIQGFSTCLGVPRHIDNKHAFIIDALTAIGAKHDRLLNLSEEISDDTPFATLRLLQVCGITRFGHVLSAVPHAKAREFARDGNEAIATTFATIQMETPAPKPTHTMSVGAGGVGLTSLERHASGSYIGAFSRIAEQLHQHLVAMRGSTKRELASTLQNPLTSRSTSKWAATICYAYAEAG